MGGKVARGKYSYWIKYGPHENDVYHFDAKGEFKPDELDGLVDLLLYLREKRSKKSA